MVWNRSVWSVMPDDVGRLRALGRDPHLGAGVALRAAVEVGGVVDHHRLSVGGDQGGDRAGAVIGRPSAGR